MALAQPPISDEAARLLRAGLAPTTRASYQTGVNAFHNYCDDKQIPYAQRLPALENVLINFVGHLAPHYAPGTLRAYLTAIRSWHIDMGYGDPLDGCLLLQRCMRGAKRLYSQPRRAREPFTMDLLRRIWPLKTGSPWDDVLFRAALCLGFFGFLRLGEMAIATSSTTFDPAKHACLGDLRLINSGQTIAFTIKVSKTDPFRQGSVVHIGATNTPICPVATILTYRNIRTKLDARDCAPLLCHLDGRPLDKVWFISAMQLRLRQLGIDATGYTGHSLRIGAATTAAAAGVPDWLIKTMGRWRSDCYQTYIKTPIHKVAAVSAALASSTVGPTSPTYIVDD